MLLKAYLLREYFMWLTVNSHFNDAAERTVTLPLFDFSTYFKFFIGLFALVNPVGIIRFSLV